MTTYICKCGRTFQKNTGAGTTGFRMPDYGPEHECYGCPFVQKECWRENGKDVDAYACRGSKVLDYQTDAYCCDSKGAALHVRTLDFEFIQRFFKEYLTLPSHNYEHLYHGMDSPENGRWPYSFGFNANKQGEMDRKALIGHYFRSEGERPGALPSGCDKLIRKDVTPEQEKGIVLNQIKEAKALAQGNNTPVEVGTVYYHRNLAYFADQRGDNKKFTVFMDDAERPCPSTRTEVATIPDFDTFDEAQNALDGLALKRGFTTERSVGGESLEAEQPDGDPDDLGPDGMEELAEYRELTQPDTDEAPESGNDEADSGDDANETPGPDNNSGDLADDDTKIPPQTCDWKNASGGDDEDEDDPEDEPEEVSGDPLSLRGPEFDAVVTTADGVLNRLVAMLYEKKQRDGEMTIKVTFEDADGMGAYIFSGAVSGKINYTVKPQKIVGDAVELQFDAQGNPIVPADCEHQLSFDEIQPGQREYPPSGGTATVDEETGIVEEYQDDEEEADSAEDEAPDEAPENCPEESENPGDEERSEPMDEDSAKFESEDEES